MPCHAMLCYAMPRRRDRCCGQWLRGLLLPALLRLEAHRLHRRSEHLLLALRLVLHPLLLLLERLA